MAYSVFLCYNGLSFREKGCKEMKNTWKEIYAGFFDKKQFWPRLVVTITAVIIMGFCLSWLLLVDLGTDPCTLMNNSIAQAIGMSLGNW